MEPCRVNVVMLNWQTVLDPNVVSRVSAVCAYLFTMPPDKQPHSQSFNKHVNISHALKQDLSKHENKTVSHPSVYSFVFIRSDLECRSPWEQETDGAMSFY